MATHDDTEYMVDDAAGHQHVFSSPWEAAAFAISIALSHGEPVNLDVVCWSRAAAVAYRGSEDGGVEYDEDPEGSVFERIVVTAVSQGRVA